MPTPFDHRPEEWEWETTARIRYEGDMAHLAFMQVAKGIAQIFAQEGDQMMLEAKLQEQQALQIAQQMEMQNNVSHPIPQFSKRSQTNGIN